MPITMSLYYGSSLIGTVSILNIQTHQAFISGAGFSQTAYVKTMNAENNPVQLRVLEEDATETKTFTITMAASRTDDVDFVETAFAGLKHVMIEWMTNG